MDDQIQNFITKSRTSGQTDDQIKQSLIKSGWTEDQLNQIFPAPQPTLQSSGPKKSSLLSVILIASLLVITVGSTSAFVYSKSKVKISPTPTTPLPTNAPSPTPQLQTTKTFSSPDLEYTFNYPDNWTVKDINRTVLVGPPQENSQFSRLIVILPWGQIIPSEAYPSSNSIHQVTSEQITVAGTNAVQLTMTSINEPVIAPGSKTLVTYVNSSTQTYQIQLNDTTVKEYVNGYKSILDSLKFTVK